MRDAVILAQNYLQIHTSHDRKVLLVITDGNDNASMATMDQLRQMTEHNETAIFAVALFRDGGTARRGRRELERLTERTGGVMYSPASIEQIDSVMLEMATLIRNQDTIAYTRSIRHSTDATAPFASK